MRGINWKKMGVGLALTLISILVILGLIDDINKMPKGTVEGYIQEFNEAPMEADIKSLVGTSEVLGQGSNQIIDSWFRELGYDTLKDDTPWCGTFVGYLLKNYGFSIPKQPLRARAYEYVQGEDIDVKDAIPYHTVVVAWRNSPESGSGHLGFFKRLFSDGDIELVGGNQSNKVTDTYRLSKERVTRIFNPKLV